MNVGETFEELRVVDLPDARHARCVCGCGNTVIVRQRDLIRGHNKSCGCRLSRVTIQRNQTHGRTSTKTYAAWGAMKTRTSNPNASNFKFYGGRGITVCDEWAQSFENFLSDMGECPEGHSLDRINVDGNYTPDNCRWVSHFDQMNNTRRNRFLKFQGERLSISQWARKQNLNPIAIIQRLGRGWSIEKTLTTPLRNDSDYSRKYKLYEYNGEIKTITEWAKVSNIPRNVLDQRIRRGGIRKALSEAYVPKIEKAMDKPVRQV